MQKKRDGQIKNHLFLIISDLREMQTFIPLKRLFLGSVSVVILWV